MAKFVEYGNYGGGTLKEIVTLNLDNVAAIEMSAGATYATIYLSGGNELNIDAENLTSLGLQVEAYKLKRTSP